MGDHYCGQDQENVFALDRVRLLDFPFDLFLQRNEDPRVYEGLIEVVQDLCLALHVLDPVEDFIVICGMALHYLINSKGDYLLFMERERSLEIF